MSEKRKPYQHHLDVEGAFLSGQLLELRHMLETGRLDVPQVRKQLMRLSKPPAPPPVNPESN